MSGPGGQATFPSADPPNLIRAQQKDEVYLQHLTGACHDAVRRVLGPHAALRWASETRLAAELLYLGLTTGAGRQTLGEEYCDILQVAGAGAAPPGAARRGLLVLLQASGPYLADRLAVPPDDGGDAAFAAWREAQQAAAAQQQQAAQGQQDGQQQQQAAQLLHRLAAALQQLRCEVQRAAQPLARHVPAAAAALRDHGATLLRLHLDLFYLYGAYYQPSKRAAGVRYLFLGRAFEGRPSYRVLGGLLLAQLGASALLWLLRRRGSLPAVLAGGQRGADAQGRLGHAALLAEDGSLLADAPIAAAAGDAGSEAVAGRRCPLCLSARSCPTATPCGHVFCWQCICDWCSQRAERPECPLCRADFTPSALVVVRHADF